ncbi:MAG: hypothetical protein QM496_20495 [Verrucomicrobiota bacterium]
MTHHFPFYSLLTAVCLLPLSSQALDFEADIQPILKKKCFKCHSGPKAKKGLRWDKAEVIAEWIKEGKDSVIIPGSPVKSLMFVKTDQGRKSHPDGMPPLRRGEPLSESELRLVAKWITEGAKMNAGDAGSSAKKMATKDDDKIHGWTNLSGQTIKAGFVRLEEKAVVLKLESGKEITYPMSKLTPESRQQAKKLAEGQ